MNDVWAHRHLSTGPDTRSRSATARRAPAALAHVAATRRAHLGPAGHAERGVDGGAGDLLEELGAGVGLAGVELGGDLAVLVAVGVLGLDVLGFGVSRRLLRNLLNHRG